MRAWRAAVAACLGMGLLIAMVPGQALAAKTKPEVQAGRCVPVEPVKVGKKLKYKGKYSGPECVKRSKAGHYEWFEPGSSAHFTGSAPSGIRVQEKGAAVASCSGASSVGEWIDTDLVRIHLVLSGCVESESTASCQSLGASEGTIEFNPLSGGFNQVEPDHPHLVLSPESGEVLTEYECAGVHRKMMKHIDAALSESTKDIMTTNLAFEFDEQNIFGDYVTTSEEALEVRVVPEHDGT
jgi:hypothetical protein